MAAQINTALYNNNIIIINLEGKIDREHTLELQNMLKASVDNVAIPFLCLDMTNVDYMCSMTLGTFIFYWKYVNDKKGQLKFVVANDFIKKILRLTRLDNYFEYFPTREECLATFQ